MAPGQRPAKELLPVIPQRLQLVTTSTRRQMPGLILVWPYAPMELTKQGQRLLQWLMNDWSGWAGYTWQFPCEHLVATPSIH